MQYCYQAPFGTLLCRLHNDLPAEILLQHSAAPFLPALPNETPLAQWLDSYFSSSPTPLPPFVPPAGTAFQQAVWAQIAQIPFGETRSYQWIAKSIGSHPRPVGGACGKNPLPLLIPCHRVLSANGLGGFSMGGDAERSLAVKRWLLAHEGVAL